jgi:para-aminobenzoate synthetase/4-amino-4-deoxychorismate lyase
MPAPSGPVPSHFPADPAQGIFETLLVVEGRPIELDAHLARMTSSVRTLFDAQIGQEAEELLVKEASPIRLGRLRLTARPPEDGGRGHGTDPTSGRRSVDGNLMLAASSAEVEPSSIFPTAEQAVTLRSTEVPGGLGPHKWADRSLLERFDGDVPLLVDSDGAALEASRANLFAVRDGVLTTPALDGRILPGVTRACVLEIAGAIGLDTRETRLANADLNEADEVFLTGSMRGVEPVRSIDGTELQTEGEVTQRVARALRRRWFG